MRIAVCVKQVPVEADLRMEEGRWTLIRKGVPSRINPHDLQALEMALTFREAHGGDVLVLTMGPPESEEALREALAMGADQGVLVTDPAFSGSDTLATSAVLARAIGRLDPSPDLILCGTRTTDSDTGQVGPQVAEELGLPHVAYVTEVRRGEQGIIVARRVDRQRETLRVPLPALLTVLQSPSRPRDIPLSSVEAAFGNKGIGRWNAEDLGFEPHEVGLSGSATRVRRIREPEAGRKTRLVQGSASEAVQAIVQALRERYIVD